MQVALIKQVIRLEYAYKIHMNNFHQIGIIYLRALCSVAFEDINTVVIAFSVGASPNFRKQTYKDGEQGCIDHLLLTNRLWHQVRRNYRSLSVTWIDYSASIVAYRLVSTASCQLSL